MIPHNLIRLYNFPMRTISFLKSTLSHFNSKNSSQMAAALSYYSLFAIAPVLLILFSVLELFLSNTQTQNAIISEAYSLFSPEIVEVIQNIIIHIADYPSPNNITGTISIIILLISSTTIVRELQKIINVMWEIKPNSLSVSQRFRKRLISFIFLVILGLLLFISFIINTLLSSIGQYLSAYIGYDPFILLIINQFISLFTVSILFALLLRYLPDATLAWPDILLGSFFTGFLFVIGKNIISYVLAHIAFGTLYGTAGTVLAFLLWVYYTSLIFLFGCAFTYMYAKHHGSGVTIKN